MIVMVDEDAAAGAALSVVAISLGLLATNEPGPLLDGWLIEVFHGTLPGWTSYPFAGATLLGEAWLFVPVLAAAYWFGDAERVAPTLGLIFGGLALAVVLKAAFALPRPTTGPMIPPEAAYEPLRGVYAWTIRADGYGFPSAHAVGAVLTWGSLAGALRAGSRRARVAVAATFVALAATSRVALGIHYAVDALGGVVVGLALLFGWRATLHRVQRPVAASLVAGMAAAALPVALGVGGDSPLSALGAVAGALVAWFAVGRPDRPFRRGFAGVGTTVVGLGGVFGAGIVVGALVPGPVGSVATTAAMAAAIFTWPVAVRGVRHRVGGVESHG